MRRMLGLVAAALALSSCAPLSAVAVNGKAATASLQQTWFGDGRWKLCPAANCPQSASDSGADALSYNAYFGWKPLHDNSYVPYMSKLVTSAPTYGPPCRNATCRLRSDVPMWDAVALMRLYDGTDSSATAMNKTLAALAALDGATVYARGACPDIAYREPFGGTDKLKTLATESNYVKAALLVYHFTNDKRYLNFAERRYAAVRKRYLDPHEALYTAYAIDDGKACRQVPHRFLASVNGNMIYDGFLLNEFGRGPLYRAQAIATAKAVERRLSDARGVYANLQDEDDVADPLIEAMYVLTYYWNQEFARSWLVRNAAAVQYARDPDGSFGRFFDGPPPEGSGTAWQTNGGFALMLAVEALNVQDWPPPATDWSGAKRAPANVTRLPLVLRFKGSGIALRGTLGEGGGDAHVFIDGVETYDQTGLRTLSHVGPRANAVLFAWRWPTAGLHEIRLMPGGGPTALHLTSYEVITQ